MENKVSHKDQKNIQNFFSNIFQKNYFEMLIKKLKNLNDYNNGFFFKFLNEI
jgi:hypothetical protein